MQKINFRLLLVLVCLMWTIMTKNYMDQFKGFTDSEMSFVNASEKKGVTEAEIKKLYQEKIALIKGIYYNQQH